MLSPRGGGRAKGGGFEFLKKNCSNTRLWGREFGSNASKLPLPWVQKPKSALVMFLRVFKLKPIFFNAV